jgi:predicted DNA-binding transcriptional regulator AlpA
VTRLRRSERSLGPCQPVSVCVNLCRWRTGETCANGDFPHLVGEKWGNRGVRVPLTAAACASDLCTYAYPVGRGDRPVLGAVLSRADRGGGTTDDPWNALPECGSCLPKEPRRIPSRSRTCLPAGTRASHPPADRGGIVTSHQGMPSTPTPSTPQLLTIDDLRRLFRCGRTTAYARVHESGFPAPLVLSGSAHRWWQHEVLAWLEGHRVQRSTGNASGPQDRDATRARKSAPPTPQPVELRRRNRAR